MEIITKLFLSFSHETVILPLIIIGYIWFNQNVFFQAICLLLSSMLLNAALKVTFKIPLNPELGKTGFAFPSGHMQSTTVFYGWLYSHFKNFKFRIFIIFILSGVGYSLVYNRFHNYLDVFGALFFGILLILSARLVIKKYPKIYDLICITFASLLMLYIYLMNTLTNYNWMVYLALIGIIFSHRIFVKAFDIVLTKRLKLLNTLIAILLVGCIKMMFGLIDQNNVIYTLQWLLVGLSLPFSRFICNKIKQGTNA
ncbi:MAG: phosphatase PAP2 family protein [Rickettsiales bacterium]|nr:phosphatase PAP2 family protein [Rickettsiales bacterium]